MGQADERGTTDHVPVMLTLPERSVKIARVHAAQTKRTRNAVVIDAMREYAPILRRVPK